MDPRRYTHHVLYDRPGRRVAMALCGLFLPVEDAVPAPTCPVCKALLAERDRDIETAYVEPSQ